MPEEQDKSKTDLQAFLSLAKDRFKKASDAEATIRSKALDDIKFSIGDNQWPPDIAKRREEEGKPVITVNRLDQHLKLVGNEQRQQRPAVKVNPVGDGADKEIAEIFQGCVRHIEVCSDAEVVYDEAFDGMLRGGFHYFRVLTKYLDESDVENHDQEIYIKLIKNAFRVYFDPDCEEPDYSDAKYCFIVQDLSPSEYKEQYPKSEMASLEDFSSTGDQIEDEWASDTNIRVAEYFYVEQDYVTVKSKTGREKRVTNRKVKWAKINAIEKLEEQELPGKWITVVPVLGVDKIVDGKRYLAGLIRNAKGAQRSYNYWISTACEAAGLAPKAPFIADARAVADFKEMWEQANRRNFATLYYNSEVDGVKLDKPERQVAEPPIEAFAKLIQQADYDLKSSLGMFDPSLGQNKSDQSGRAIQSLQKQGDLATLNYSDNLSRSIRHLGRILIDLIPHIYDAPRIQRIIKPDGGVDHVGVFNSQAQGGMTADQVKAMQEFQNIKKIYDLGVGTYDVTVSVGPSYQTKRQEAAQTQLDLMKNVPVVAQAAPDIVIRNMDLPGSDAIADRVQKLLPPNLLDQGDDPKQQVAQLSAQLNQVQQQNQELLNQAADMKEKLNAKTTETQGKLEAVKMQERTKVLVAEITTKSQEANTRMQMELEVWKQLNGNLHEASMGALSQAHEQDMNDKSQTFESQENEAGRQHESSEAAAGRAHESQEGAAQRQHESEQAANAQVEEQSSLGS